MGLKASWTIYALGFILVGILLGNGLVHLEALGHYLDPKGRLAFVLAFGLGGFIFATYSFSKLVEMFENFGRMPLRDKLLGLVGLSLGALLAYVIVVPLLQSQSLGALSTPLSLVIVVVCVLLSIGFSLSMRDQIVQVFPKLSESEQSSTAQIKLLDTNVIIDGRILDIWETGFLEGPIRIPEFVLSELQHIADSADDLKRSRGRRGMEILKELQKRNGDVEVINEYPPEAKQREAVDLRLVKLGKALGAAIVTNDFSLNHIAQLHQVPVLNINELANALKPAVLPGEPMVVTIVRPGKGPRQGVGYLDDGTMVVVEGARALVGETVEATVTSVIQTSAGKMIFADVDPESLDKELSNAEQNIRSYSGSRSRRKE